MDRPSMINRVGIQFLTTNIENSEYSYVREAGSKAKLIKALGFVPEHIKLDIRFENDNDIVIMIETKENFKKKDEDQLREYLAEERALHSGKKIICILANTKNDKIKVWRSIIDDQHLLINETVLDTMEHYASLFEENSRQNNREKVLKNTYILNETLHKKDIDEKLRSQFIGTSLLYIKRVMKILGISTIDKDTKLNLCNYWKERSSKDIRSGIEETLEELLDGSDNKTLKVELLQKNVLTDQKIKKLTPKDWVDILDEIVWNIYKYINTNTSEGQDILNLFFIAFNKYTGKADKNQAFTPDHITNFMCRITEVNHTKRIFDGTSGSGSFLVQAMVIELADVNKQKITEKEKDIKRKKILKEHIYGVEIEEKAFGLCTTNMLIHGDGNSNIQKASLFDSSDFIKQADPDIILMNPPYNAKPITIPNAYKEDWKSDAKEDPTKGLVFLKFISDTIKKMNDERSKQGKPIKEVKVAILLPVSAAIGSNNYISDLKNNLLENNTLEGVFSLPAEIFYPGASASACCMVFTLGKSHVNADGTTNKTFFGYYKEDGHKKKRNLGRIEQFDKNNNSIWKQFENKWLELFRNKTVEDGLSAMQVVSGNDEWLCEAYMKTDYSKLSKIDFQKTLNNYFSYAIQIGEYPLLDDISEHSINLELSKWKEFKIADIAQITNGKGLTIEEIEDNEGDIPCVQGGLTDNGSIGLISREYCLSKRYVIIESKCLTVARVGTAGCVNYWDKACAIGDKCKAIILNDDKDKATYLFIQTILNQLQYKYSYGRGLVTEKYLNEIIKLPVDNKGEPDWEFMSNYMKSLRYGNSL